MNSSHHNQILDCRPKLYRFALSLTKNVDDAEDIYQETVLKLWELKDSWAGWQSFEAYAMRMVRNIYLNKVKKDKTRAYISLDDITEQTGENETESNIVIAELRLRFYSLISKLPQLQRDILHLREIEEMEYKEIAAVLEISEAQVKVYLYRARQYLKKKTNGKR
jgi:RNA polymerase sigma-70 factor (ECF subfamily)